MHFEISHIHRYIIQILEVLRADIVDLHRSQVTTVN
jgi:hypothetical protein